MTGLPYSTIPPSNRDYGWLRCGRVIGKAPLPPLNLQPPVISGLVAVGSTIAVSQGSWRTSPPTSYRYQWLRNGTAVADATVNSYLLAQADLSATMIATVTAINVAGSASAIAIGVGPVAPAPITVPVNTVPPVISGTPQVGSTLAASTGTWTGSLATYTYQWLRNGVAIATGNSYLLAAADLGAVITVTVTASNSAGSASTTSAGVGPVSGTIPVNTVLPVISGTTQVGSTLTTTNGNWTGTPAPTYTYQWLRGGVAIGSATANTYLLVIADLGATIAVTVTASNAGGSASATAAGVGPITAATSAEVSQFLSRTSGLDATHTNAYTALIDGLVADAVWSKLDLLQVYATQDLTTAKLNLVSSNYPAVANGSPTFTANRGFTGVTNSSTVYIDTGFKGSVGGTQFSQNSGHISAWSVADIGALTNAIAGAVQAGVGEYDIYPRAAGDLAYFRLQGGGATGFANASGSGHYVSTRASSASVEGYKNAGFVGSTVGNYFNAIPAVNAYACGVNNAGAAIGSAYQCAMASIGSNLTATDVTNFYNRLRTYMTAVGVP